MQIKLFILCLSYFLLSSSEYHTLGAITPSCGTNYSLYKVVDFHAITIKYLGLVSFIELVNGLKT